MKISASIYSGPSTDIENAVRELVDHQADLIHVDCNDDPSVFEDIKAIRALTDLPIDLHLITSDPGKYEEQLKSNPVEYLTLQHEVLTTTELPSAGFDKLGIAFTSETPIVEFANYNRCDFVLMMATVPGKSGGQFSTETFKRIRDFKGQFKGVPVHVDGGVNDEVSFILRNLGVRCAVSGSYLYGEQTIGGALVKLKNAETDSHFLVKDFMRDGAEIPSISESELSLRSALESIEHHGLGFTTVVTDDQTLRGIISNADVRKALLNHINDLSSLDPTELVNTDPVVAKAEMTVTELLSFIRSQSFPINFLPVTESDGKLAGVLSFNELIKGES